ncbi:unnamed protein product [Rotaria sp. Silwood2]|nr:unnamed protein product [Rotaria sp. Silwood2]
MTKNCRYLDILLHAHRNKIEHPKEKLILLVHWTFLSRNFNIVKNNEYNQIMDEIKSENNLTNVGNNPHALLIPKFQKTIDLRKNETNSIDIDYFGDNFIIHTKQFFDNENFYIKFNTDECNQLHFQIPVNNIINENDGSLKCVDDFVIDVAIEIYELIIRQKKMDKLKEEELEKRQTNINQ